MPDYIAIDSGTSNTRISLIRDHEICQSLFFPVGATKGITDKNVLRKTTRDGITQLLQGNALQ